MHHVSFWYFRLLVIAATVTYVLAVMCYTCVGDGCRDPFDESQAVQISCNGSCLKEIKNDHIQRHCTESFGFPFDDKCIIKIGGTETCFCSTNLCNGSDKRNISLIYVKMSFLAFVWLK
ncbi:protein quiver-like [Ruditapes philippinarum]|uniref:protein quiver-like n=1 Tax=Ruditapes philippinarum TaxID=129788 RepID=UPI00295BFCA6|nr:protein quiver-like [Ruditapes philippinarum]